MLTGIQLVFDGQALIHVLPYFAGTVLLVTFLAGYYPAFHLSRFPAISVLKNLTVSVRGNGLLRKGLVTTQYVFVISILAALIIVNQQYSFMSNKSLGFTTEEMIILEINSGDVRNNYESFKNDLLQVRDIKGVTGLTRMISGYRSGTSVSVNELDKPGENVSMRFYGMDADGPSTLAFELVYGKNFSGVESLDSVSILFNETAAARYGGNSIVGKYVEIEELGDDKLKAKVIGIVKDFHYRSLHDAIGPVVIGYYNNPFVSLDDIVIMLTWEFMDDMIQRAYEEEQTFRNIFVGASLLDFFCKGNLLIRSNHWNITYLSEILLKRMAFPSVGYRLGNFQLSHMSFFLSVVLGPKKAICKDRPIQ